jgi:SAM-dependent methyltransferase
VEQGKFARELKEGRGSASRINAQYNTAAPDSLPARIARYQRRKMFRAFMAFAKPQPQDTILDVGVTSDRSYDHSNYFAAWYPHKAAITAVGLDDASFLSALYPGLRFVRADGRDLPFAQASFDYIHSSAVIEHVGDRRQQTRFLGEAWRVARKGIFVTTPNRWFPVEFHTILPLLHWAPPRFYRSILTRLGRDFFACESNLNLRSRSDLAQLAAEVGIAGGNIANIGSVALCGWPTNLLLRARKSAS